MKIYVDGENFRKGIAELLIDGGVIKSSRKMTKYPLRKLLEDELADQNLVIQYYASKIKLPQGFEPSKETLQHVDKIKHFNRAWVPNLLEQKIDYIKAGLLKVRAAKPCQKCSHAQEILQEKGVDVRIAIDIFKDVIDDKEKAIAIFSSDTDLCPVLHEVKKRGVKVFYICFSDRTNRAISAVAHETIAISTAKVKNYGKT